MWNILCQLRVFKMACLYFKNNNEQLPISNVYAAYYVLCFDSSNKRLTNIMISFIY